MGEEFGESQTIVTLGLTFYLFGLAIGSMFMAPLSEVYGRKPVCIVCLTVFTILIIPCALAKSVTALIVVRFIAAFFGSVMISTAPGMVADLVDDEHRALAISVWSIGPLNGPGLFFICSLSRHKESIFNRIQSSVLLSEASSLNILAGVGCAGSLSFSPLLPWSLLSSSRKPTHQPFSRRRQLDSARRPASPAGGVATTKRRAFPRSSS